MKHVVKSVHVGLVKYAKYLFFINKEIRNMLGI